MTGSTYTDVNVKEDFGAKGDGVTDDRAAIQAALDAAFGPASSPHGISSTGCILNRAVFFPCGTYNISAPLILTDLMGAYIYGAGRMATKIVNTATSGATGYGSVFKTDGYSFSNFCHMWLVAAAPSGGSRNVCFDWDGGGTRLLDELIFQNVRFEGGDEGIGIGPSGVQGSEITFLHCDFVNCVLGITGYNANALDATVLGGSFHGCTQGIAHGTVAAWHQMQGVSFSGSVSADIRFDSFDGMVVEACTSTSAAFLDLVGSVPMHVKSCTYTPAATGSFAKDAQALFIIDGCIATNCKLSTTNANGTNDKLYMRGNNLPGTFLTGVVGAPQVIENI